MAGDHGCPLGSGDRVIGPSGDLKSKAFGLRSPDAFDLRSPDGPMTRSPDAFDLRSADGPMTRSPDFSMSVLIMAVLQVGRGRRLPHRQSPPPLAVDNWPRSSRRCHRLLAPVPPRPRA